MFGLPKFGDGIGLYRIERFFEAFGIDTQRLAQRSIAVTGSNGKGSTARFIAGALETYGNRVGCFTSPHLFDVRERFLIGDAQIQREVFDAHAETVLAFNRSLPEGDRMGAFEALYLIAILWFESEQLDAIVWEAGIGGRYDPVRTARAMVSAITSIELEHTQILGATEELIAYDKSDALSPGGVLVLSPAIPRPLAERIASYARLSWKSVCYREAELSDMRVTQAGSSFSFRIGHDIRDIEIGLIGRHQIDNAMTALQAATSWIRGRGPSEPERLLAPDTYRMFDGLARVRWPGRLQKAASDPDLWIDVGHTPHALDVVTEAFLEILPREKTLVVFGVSAAKDVNAIASLVASRFDRFILTQATKAGADPGLFRSAFTATDASVAATTSEAARLARSRADSEGLCVLAIGGLFLAVEVAHAWTGDDPATLDFL